MMAEVTILVNLPWQTTILVNPGHNFMEVHQPLKWPVTKDMQVQPCMPYASIRLCCATAAVW